ncbi:MAG: siderophore-interacting protein [Actinomycetaceae bacterium]|nr:siderophore-interacting protein [Actinomycetaceae bacterium]
MRTIRPFESFPICARILRVLRVEDITDGMRRVTLGGEGLAAHTAPNGLPVIEFDSHGFDDDLKLVFTHPDADAPVYVTQSEGRVNWPREDPHFLMRTYTARRWDAQAGELDIDFVTHGVGVATTWAMRAKPGDEIQVIGPKGWGGNPVGVDWIMVGADETALPAVGRWLEQWPEGVRGQVFIEIAEDSHRQDLVNPEGVEITWLSRGGAAAGTKPLLHDALTNAPWWDGEVYVWVAGEALSIAPIRRWLRKDKEIPRERVEVTGYWRYREVDSSAADAALPDPNAMKDLDFEFHELIDIIPGVALRVARTIGLDEPLLSGPQSFAELLSFTGTDENGLRKLLRYLAAIGIVVEEGDVWSLTPLGYCFDSEHFTADLDMRGPQGLAPIHAAVELACAVREGRSQHDIHFGSSWNDYVLQRPEMVRNKLDLDAMMAGFVSGALASNPLLARLRSITFVGRGAIEFAQALRSTQPGMTVNIVEPDAIAQTLRREFDTTGITVQSAQLNDPFPCQADAVFLSDTTSHRSDGDVVELLSAASASITPGGVVLVGGYVLGEDSDDHALANDLVNFALTGGGLRTAEEIEALATEAGLTVQHRMPMAWGLQLFVLGSVRTSGRINTELRPVGEMLK